MGLRLSSGNGPLPDLIRSRQDLEREWQRLDKLLLAAVNGAAAQGERNSLRGRIADVEHKLAATDAQLRKSFPQYFEFAVPTPLQVAPTQTLLGDKEAIAQFAVVGEQAYLWVVTKLDARWVAIPETASWIETVVFALRCGLDFEGSWGSNAPSEVKQRCRDLVKRTYAEADARVPRPMPFDLGRAHQLHLALFGQVQDLIAGKALLDHSLGCAFKFATGCSRHKATRVRIRIGLGRLCQRRLAC